MVFLDELVGNVERVGAASVGPGGGEGDLLVRALLQEELATGVEQKDTEGAVKHALVDVGHQVGWIEGRRNGGQNLGEVKKLQFPWPSIDALSVASPRTREEKAGRGTSGAYRSSW